MTDDRPALRLADAVRRRYRGIEPLTHLKLQKLAFYGYGAAVAYDCAGQLTSVVFEPWAHGPVSRSVWQAFRGCGRQPIQGQPELPDFHGELGRVLDAVVSVYGRISAWGLREQSHAERPWREAWENQLPRLRFETIRAFFKHEFADGQVYPPSFLLGRASYDLDEIPVLPYASLFELADALDRPA